MTGRVSSQSRREARGVARRLISEYGSVRAARDGLARFLADDVAAGFQPHPDHVQAYRLLDRLERVQHAALTALLVTR